MVTRTRLNVTFISTLPIYYKGKECSNCAGNTMRYLTKSPVISAPLVYACSATPEHGEYTLALRQSVFLTDAPGKKKVKVTVVGRSQRTVGWPSGQPCQFVVVSCGDNTVQCSRFADRAAAAQHFTAWWARWVRTVTRQVHCSLALFSVLCKGRCSKSPKSVMFPTFILLVQYSNLARDTNYPGFSRGSFQFL
jgi:hypothetical protein